MTDNTIRIDLSRIGKLKIFPDPGKYQLSDELKNAVNVALTLGQPLLLTGEPGTGKTQLAHKIAYDLSKEYEEFYKELFVFNTKTTSMASDLFYVYDAISHFRDANIKKTENRDPIDVSNYIKLQALGKAIALSNITDVDKRYVEKLSDSETQDFTPKSSVVLIDEIDKAPRDFPNDLLDEIENLHFRIKEDNYYTIKKGNDRKIIVVITSNSEKNLPDAFLRRCVFYNITFPGKEELQKIVQSHLGNETKYTSDALIDFFMKEFRDKLTRKKPATVELIAWLKMLEIENFLGGERFDPSNLSVNQKDILRDSFPILAKNLDDMKTLEENFLKGYKIG